MRSIPLIRPEEPADLPSVHRLIAAAFGGRDEADLVEHLRADGDLVLSLVAVEGGPVGHVAFSLLSGGEADLKAVALAPLAVAPDFQNRGIGSALVWEGLRRLNQAGADLVLVFGDPRFYTRFGFDARSAAAFTTPYDGPHLQALALTPRGAQAGGEVRYARAFAAVG